MSSSAHRGRILHFLGDPAKLGDKAWEYFEDGLLWIEHGHVRALDHATYLLPQLPADLPLEEHPQRLLLPGFVDCHVHYPQLGVIASYGTQLLDWLETHTFPAEQRFADAGYAAAQAELFLDELLRHGTTTALVFGTVHAVSAEAFFQAAQKRRLRMIAGKVLMDRNAPPALCDTAASGYAESRALIERWHGNGRLQYAVTPRFAPTSSPEQLAAAARLLDEYPGVYLHTHLSENLKEVAWVGERGAGALSQFQPVHRLRPVRPWPRPAIRHPRRHRQRRRRRHQPVAAGQPRRRLQDPAIARHQPRSVPGALPGHPRRRQGARPGRPGR